MPTLRAVIFDLDGLLVDSEPIFYQAYHDILQEHGFALSQEEFISHWTRSGGTISSFVAARGLDLDPVALRQERQRRSQKLARESLQPMPGAIGLLESLRGCFPLALATSSLRSDVAVALEKFGWQACFDLIATNESVPRAKPHPDIFLHVATALSVLPASCIVLEDAEKGVRAAAAAGMKCIAVPNEFTQADDFSGATAVVSSLVKVTPKFLRSLFLN